MTDEFDDNIAAMDAEESLLYSARHGEALVVRSMLDAKKDGKLTLDINCKGKNKGNSGWTPLHLATYFGHVEVVRALLEAGADVDALNDSGDTPLHKACFIGNEELVMLLLNHNADVFLMNGVGSTALTVCASNSVRRLIEGAEKAERARVENQLLSAARDGNVEALQELLTSQHPPNINSSDAQGNTALHVAAYRGHARLAVLLLQNGVNTHIRNHRGQLAIELAKDEEIRSVLNVRPVQRLARVAHRFEGPLMKRSRLFGTRPIWAVLQRGVLLYYSSRAEAARSGGKFRNKQYLDGARVVAPDCEPSALIIHYSDGDVHRLVVPGDDVQKDRQAWVTALGEHAAYSGHYLWAGAGGAAPDAAREATEDDDECKPLGSMSSAMTSAHNNLSLLESQLRECAAILAALRQTDVNHSLHHSAYMRFQHASSSGAAALSSLKHCVSLIAQTRDRDREKLQQEIERNRVLEEALAALARTHHELEMSVAEELTKSKRKKRSSNSKSSIHTESKENFYDVCDESDDDDTLVTAGLASPLGALSPFGSSLDLRASTPTQYEYGAEDKTPVREDSVTSSMMTAVSPASSQGTLVSTGGHVYRNARRHRRTTNSSQWSI